MIEAEHSPIAPSSADIWMNCPGSVAMQAAQPPEEETEESREGMRTAGSNCSSQDAIIARRPHATRAKGSSQ